MWGVEGGKDGGRDNLRYKKNNLILKENPKQIKVSFLDKLKNMKINNFNPRTNIINSSKIREINLNIIL